MFRTMYNRALSNDGEETEESMKRPRTPLRRTMSEERLSLLAILHIHKHENVDIDPFPVETITAYNTLIYTYTSNSYH